MVDQIPDDAIVYAGWTSGRDLKEAYANSHLKRLIDASNLRSAFDDFLPQILDKIGSASPQDAQSTRRLTSVLRILLRHPAAVYFEGLDLTDPAMPLPKIGLVCDAAKDADQLQRDLKALIAETGQPVAKVDRTRNRVSVKFSRPSTQPIPATQAAASLRFDKSFVKALGEVHSDPTAIVFVDMPRLLSSIDDAFKHSQDGQFQSPWNQAVDLLGLRGVQQAIWTADFEGANWGHRCFIAAAAPRKGMVAILAGQPLSDDILKAIPQTASVVSAVGFDPAALFNEISTALDQLDPSIQKYFDSNLENFQTQTGVDLKTDFLDALGPEWAEYLDSSVGGTNFLGAVYINKLRNPAKIEASLTKLEAWLNQWLAQKLAEEKIHIQFRQADLHGVKLHYLATPALSPSWAIANGRLYISLYPEITAAAVGASDGKNSILDNVSFSAMRTRLAPAPGQTLTAINYIDLAQFAPHTYASWVMLTRFAGFADLFGIQSPLQIMPPLSTIMNELTPAASVSWTDNAGLHSRSISPFPGSQLLMIDPTSMYQQSAPMLASMLLPSLNRARTMANRVKSASNLRQLGQAMLLYSNEHNGEYPPSLGEIWLNEEVAAEVFLNPSGTQSLPPRPMDNKQAMMQWINTHSDYVYLGKGHTSGNIKPDEIVAYEKFTPASEGANALFGDGRVEWLDIPTLKRYLKRQ
jgi:prepilin-type processing-associated H-X9-DG protein